MDQNLEIIDQSTEFENLCFGRFNDEDNEQTQFFANITTRIEKELTNITSITEDVNKMREKVAALESELLSKVSSTTWKDISELIGLSSATILDECFKILDRDTEQCVTPKFD